MSKKLVPEKIYALTPMQEGMLFFSLLNPEEKSYFEQTTIVLKGMLDVEALERSFNVLVQRHDILRTLFLHEKIQKPRQVVVKERHTQIHVEDISHLSAEKQAAFLSDFEKKDLEKGFQLDKDILIRVATFKQSDQKYTLVWSFHHIIMDGWSNGILLGEFFQIYESQVKGTPLQLPKPTPFKNYVDWMDKQDKQKAKEYWSEYLSDYDTSISILGSKKTSSKPFKQANYRFEISEDHTAVIEHIAKSHNVSINTVFQTIWAILLQKYNATKDVAFGTVVSGRTPEVVGIDSMIGLFINTIPQRVNAENGTFKELIEKGYKDFSASSRYDFYPLADIQNQTALKHDLINHILVFENFPIEEKTEAALGDTIGFTMESMDIFEQTNYDLTVIVVPGKKLVVDFLYNANAFEDGAFERIKIHLNEVIRQVTSDVACNITQISITSQEEKKHVLQDFNPSVDFNVNRTVLDFLNESVSIKKDDLAVVFQDRKLTYAALNQQSTQLASYISAKLEGATNQAVGVFLDRSEKVLVSFLAILKSGNAYLPIDPNYPEDRIAYMLQDSGVSVLITDDSLLQKTSQYGISNMISIDSDWQNEASSDFKSPAVSGDQTSYFIYTSGSTGLPKGVQGTHQCLYNLMDWQINESGIGSGLRTIQYAALSFDVSVQEMLFSVCSGGTLYFIDNELRQDMLGLSEFLAKHEIEFITMPFSALNLLFNTVDNLDSISSIKHLATSGEQLQISSGIEHFLKKRPEVNLHNQYGPSETHVVTDHVVNASNLEALPPIGKPIKNTTVYILDENKEVVPEGVPGEIYLGGVNIATGYINKSEMTEEKFIPSPFLHGERMYRTGDLAKWRPDGTIQFLGRIDDQVKVRGHRIELGEIESTLSKNNAVKEAVVVVKEIKGIKEIVAYLVSDEALKTTDLKDFLRESLPEYMLPSYFEQLDKLPLTPNGKVNRKELPFPSGSIGSGVEYVAPATAEEKELAQIFAEVLSVEKVGVNDSFFDLGGHSLKAIHLVSRIHKVFEVKIPLQQIFDTPTITELINIITGEETSTFESIPKAPEQEYYPQSAAQKRLYFLNQLEGAQTAYNLPNVLKIVGELNVEKVEEAIAQLIHRHESFRTSFHVVNDLPVQKVHTDFDFRLQHLEAGDDLGVRIREFTRAFDLSKPGLLRSAIIKTGEKEHYLLLDMHHIISDGVSITVMIDEFVKCYQNQSLPEIDIQYKDFAYWQNQPEQQGSTANSESYWLHQLGGELPVLNLPTDYVRPALQSFKGDDLSFQLSAQKLTKLNDIAKRNDSTLFMTLLAAYNILLSKYANQDDIIVGTPVAGRTHAELQGVIGMFVNTLALRNEVKGDTSFNELLKTTKQSTLDAFEHQQYPFEHMLDKLEVPRNLDRNPIFDTMFMLQNMGIDEIKIDGLTFTSESEANKVAKFDLTLEAVEYDGKLNLSFEYATDLFKKESIQRMASHYRQIIDTIIENDTIRVADINLLTPEEETIVLEDFNQTAVDYGSYTIIDMFAKAVSSHEDSIAIEMEGMQLTYGQLDVQSNQFANFLRANHSIGKGDLVGILLDRSDKMIISMLGILKSGAAYLPIDTSLPQNRVDFILEDSQSKLLITDKKTDFSNGININEDWNAIHAASANPTDHKVAQDDLAYIIYTSGSTGKPKGCELVHGNLCNYINWANHDYFTDDNGNFGLYTSISFDLTVTSIFTTLTRGKTLYIYHTGEELNAILKHTFVGDSIIDAVKITPAHITLLKHLEITNSNVQVAIVGGDKFTKEQAEVLWKINPNMAIFNEYGPTETTVGCIVKKVERTDEKILIGKPIANTQIYIVDEQNNPVPIGVPGEIAIAGNGVGNGYLNREELTNERFLDNPFSTSGKLYKAGDLARWLPDGNIDYIGRTDYQVKIRGYRIELGEIESVMLKDASITDAVVLDRQDTSGNKFLAGYIVSKQEIDINALNAKLAKDLPEYMVPTKMLQLDAIPLTQNGKVDRRALPNPFASDADREYVAPSTDTEIQLAEVWKQVLLLDQISLDDNFFSIGGHSLRATILISKIHKTLNVQLPLRAVFQNPTLKSLAHYIDAAEQSLYAEIKPADKKEYYPLSSAQRRMYILEYIEEVGTSYNMPGVLKISGKLDEHKLISIFEQLVNRHESFRTSFGIVDDEYVQIIHDKVDFNVEVTTITEDQAVSQIEEFIRPFDLEKAPLLRVNLAKLSEEEYILMFDMHHIISDGFSMAVLVGDFIRLYHDETLDELKIQYKDFAVWEADFFKSEALESQRSYWKNEFAGEIPVIDLPTDYARKPNRSLAGEEIHFELDTTLSSQVKEMAKSTGATNYMVLMAAFNVLLSKLSGQDDIVIGSPIAGRPHADLQNIIGIFLNTLAIRNKPTANKRFDEFLGEVKQSALEAFENQDYPFEDLLEQLDVKRDLSRNPLFDVMLIHQDIQLSEPQSVSEIAVEQYEFEGDTSKVDLTLKVSDGAEKLSFGVEYCTDLFKKETIHRFIAYFKSIVEEVMKNPAISIGEINLLDEEERNTVLYTFNQTEKEYNEKITFLDMFAEQVSKHASEKAISFLEQSLSYSELNEQSNKLAHHLKKQGVKKGDIVPIIADRSLEAIVSVMAILKCGAAYLPIDVELPEARIHFMIQDSGASMVLTQKHHIAKIGSTDINIIDINQKFDNESKDFADDVVPNDLAYVIYTSGSTGQPKGVMIHHSSWANVGQAWKEEYKLDEFKVNLLQLASFSFDVFAGDLMRTLVNGGHLIISSNDIKLDPQSLYELIEQHQINIFESTPGLLMPLMDYIYEHKLDVSHMELLILGSDTCSGENYNRLVERFAHQMRIINSYGVTEATIDSSYFESKQKITQAVTPIGKPLPNTQLYILNERLQPQPIGVEGELCISGKGLAAGYFNREDLTNEKFVKHPFDAHQKLYRTGDLAKWLPNGNIEFIGRTDFQVKIRGYRIELGEVESQLQRLDVIQEASVIDREDNMGVKFLCAYFTSEKEIDVAEIKKNLAKSLPDYMLPAFYIQVPTIPLTSNGKVDRKALPSPEGSATAAAEYIAPTNESEKIIAEIWQDVLGIRQVGIDNNFFDIGGHSLKANVVLSRIHKALDVKIPLRMIFQSPTVRQLAEFASGHTTNKQVDIPTAPHQERYPLSTAQKRIYVLEQIEDVDTSYNISNVLSVEGSFDLAKLQSVVNTIVARHSSLRTSFEMADGEATQKVHPEVMVEIEFNQCNKGEEKEIVENFIRPFDLLKAPLLRVGVVKFSDTGFVLMFDMHHIISDGVSMGILISEFVQLYQGVTLEVLPIQYHDFVVWQQQYFTSDDVKQQYDYWLNRFNDEIPKLVLPYDAPRPKVQQFEGNELSFSISKTLTDQLGEMSKANGATLYMTLLAAYNVLMSKFSAQEDILVGTPIAGRPHADIEKMIGMFVNTLVMRNYPEGGKSFHSFLNEVKQSTLEAFENQDIPFEEIVSKINIDRDLSRNPLFDTAFVLQNTTQGGTMELDDLTFDTYNHEHTVSKFDLTLTTYEVDDQLDFVFEYSTALFKEETINRFKDQFEQILHTVTQNSDILLSDISVLSETEKEMLLKEGESVEFPREETIVSIFEKQAHTTPQHIAITLDGIDVTYAELQARSNQYAHLLREMGVKSDTLVALMVDRSIEMIVSIFGILKAGGAYLPIDPDYPQDRIDYTLQDSKCTIVITQEEYSDKITTEVEQVFVSDDLIASQPTDAILSVNKSSDMAYVIYTSGSTGKPKGVMVEHRNVVRLLFTDKPLFDFNENDVWTMFHSFAFDFSVWEMYGALLFGGKLVMIPKHIAQNPADFIDLLDEQKVTVLNQTPGAFYNLMNEEVTKEEAKLSLRYVIFGGEALAPGRLEKFNVRYPDIKLINMYGITETTVHVTYKEITQQEIKTNISNIGKPIPTLTTYVFDNYGKLQPIGVTGEMYVGGDGVARGYLNREDLTKERFIVNPYKTNERLYKSGDLAKYLPNGELEYLGRNDFQVKIRGYRIELGEIESKLLALSSVKEAIVIDRTDENGHKYLCAYIVSNEEWNVSQLREELGKDLPTYMIPSYFLAMDTIPLTANGKINKKALPEPEGNIQLDVDYVPPQNEIEELLVAIWQGVLGVDKIGLKEDFFSLGGDSIKAIQVSSRLQQHQLRFELKDLFQNPTIGQLSGLVKRTIRNIDQAEVVGDVKLTPIQHYFFDQQFENKNHYNQSVMLYSKDGFDEEVLRKSFDQMVAHHDALRLKVIMENGVPRLFNQSIEEGGYSFEVFDYTSEENADDKIEHTAAQMQSAIHIEKGNFLHLGLFKTSNGDHLLITIHHLSIDGISWRVILEDLKTAYGQVSNELAPKLQLKTDSYQYWANKLQEYASSEALKNEAHYWKGIDEEGIRLPKDGEVSRRKLTDKESATIELSTDKTNALLKDVNEAYNTEINDILLSALAHAAYKWASLDHVFINLEGHGREELFEDADISRTVGWFTSIYPVKLIGNTDDDFSKLIKYNKEGIRKIPNKGVGFGILKYLTDDFTFNAKPEITFNYLGQFDEEVTSEAFTVSSLATGDMISTENHATSAIEINGMISGKQLSMSFAFNRHEFEESNIQKFAKAYKESLEQLIDYCVQKEEAEATPSDFTYAELSLEELDDLNDDLLDLLDD